MKVDMDITWQNRKHLHLRNKCNGYVVTLVLYLVPGQFVSVIVLLTFFKLHFLLVFMTMCCGMCDQCFGADEKEHRRKRQRSLKVSATHFGHSSLTSQEIKYIYTGIESDQCTFLLLLFLSCGINGNSLSCFHEWWVLVLQVATRTRTLPWGFRPSTRRCPSRRRPMRDATTGRPYRTWHSTTRLIQGKYIKHAQIYSRIIWRNRNTLPPKIKASKENGKWLSQFFGPAQVFGARYTLTSRTFLWAYLLEN